MAASEEKYCTLCDPSSVKAVEWCSECDDFLCSDCARHHKVSKTSKCHTTIQMDNYKELPNVIKTLKHYCEDHEEKLDFFCPVHNCPCCIRCSFSVHKACYGIAPIGDFIKNAKSSPSMLDLDQTLHDLISFVEKVKSNKETNKQEIVDQQNKIREEINLMRKALNDHLDKLQDSLIKKLNETVVSTSSEIDKILNDLIYVEERLQQISKDCVKMKEYASDLQTFLSLSHLVSVVASEENSIEEMNCSGYFNRKSLILYGKTDDMTKELESLGDIKVNTCMSEIDFVKEKDKQAQIIGVLPKTCENLNLKLSKTFKINPQNEYNTISGCSIMANGNILFSEYNPKNYSDCVKLCSSSGIVLRCFSYDTDVRLQGSIMDVTSIDKSSFAISIEKKLLVINSHTAKVLQTIENKSNSYGVVSCRNDSIFYLCDEGLHIYNRWPGYNRVLMPAKFQIFSYIASRDDRLYYTDDKIVRCCEMNGRQIWTFEDTSIICSPRGIAVDKDGYVYVAGEKSENIVVISPDGKFPKEVQRLTSPRAMCYCENENQILVCNLSNDVFLFKICKNE